MSESYIKANGIRLAYEEFGSPSAPAILLIMGLGTQMISWPLSLCEGLAAGGFRVIRFDNRDIGLSEKMENAHIPRAPSMLLRSSLRLPVPLRVSYTLDDMANDVIGLMDALRLDQAHLVGASMGGMIGQIATARYPHRVLSFTSIMSSSGDPRLPGASREVVRAMAKRFLGIEKPNLENSMAFQRMIGSPGYPQSDEELKQKVLDSVKRSLYPEGYSRHLAAIMAGGSRVRLLKTITVPTLVIHGRDDALVPLECGIDTARHIPDARLQIIDGMGHNLPEALMPRLQELIAAHVSQDGVACSLAANRGDSVRTRGRTA
jgi:pimeloyl-ACP methyl ester carboxylesterase